MFVDEFPLLLRLPVTDDTGVSQKLKDTEQLQPEQVSSLTPLLVLQNVMKHTFFFNSSKKKNCYAKGSILGFYVLSFKQANLRSSL